MNQLADQTNNKSSKHTTRESPKQSINQSINLSNNQSNQSINQPNHSIQWTQPLQSVNRTKPPEPIKIAKNEPMNQRTNEPASDSTTISINHTPITDQSHPSIGLLKKQHTNQPINQSIKPIKHSITSSPSVGHSDETDTTLLRAVHTPHSRLGVEASDVHIIIGRGHQVLHAWGGGFIEEGTGDGGLTHLLLP